jgi:hypothetical protein
MKTNEQKQKTIEDFALKHGYVWENTESSARRVLEKFFNYQKQSYSREEVISILKEFISDTRGNKPWVDADNEWIEQNL